MKLSPAMTAHGRLRRAYCGFVTAADGKNENCGLRHFYDGTQIHLRLGGSRRILVTYQPYRNPESINFFSDLGYFLFFTLEHFEWILHRHESFTGEG